MSRKDTDSHLSRCVDLSGSFSPGLAPLCVSPCVQSRPHCSLEQAWRHVSSHRTTGLPPTWSFPVCMHAGPVWPGLVSPLEKQSLSRRSRVLVSVVTTWTHFFLLAELEV